LLSSGVTITCAHRAILAGERKATIIGTLNTVVYGLLFSLIQAYEYNDAPFSINDGIFGSLFFMLTGFHGFHVIVGSIFLLVCLHRQINYHFTRRQHVGFECGI
jgi:cytochrome c oxidase subunit 3